MKSLVFLIVSVHFFSAAFSQDSNVYQKNGLALDGYDVVSFFTAKKPAKGQSGFAYSYDGAIWWFESQEHLDMFKKDPIAYLPQYGGYCAYGMSRGYKAPTEASAFTIKNNKLYFNYNLKVMEIWLKDADRFIPKSDSSWVKFTPKSTH